MSIKKIKKEARQTLKGLPGKYHLFAVPILLYTLYIWVEGHGAYLYNRGLELSPEADLFPISVLLFMTLFTLSATFIMLDVIRGKRQQATFSDTTLAFSRNYIGKLIAVFLLNTLFLFTLFLLASIGLLLLFATASTGGGMSIGQISLAVIGLILFIGGASCYINRLLAYALVNHILYDTVNQQTYIGSLSALERSSALVKGYKGKLFLFHLSFLGWYLGTLLTFGLLSIYSLPYFVTAKALFYDQLLQIRHKKEAQIASDA